jgi:hypothetical protein
MTMLDLEALARLDRALASLRPAPQPAQGKAA